MNSSIQKAPFYLLNLRESEFQYQRNTESEKGRSVETEVMQFLRSLLPSEYGLSTGFIAYHTNSCIHEREHSDGIYECWYKYDEDEIQTSSQIDIVIYNALRFCPLIRLGGCDVFPLEAVCAYVEVKSWIDNRKDKKTGLTPIEKLLIQSNTLRSMKVRLYHVSIPGTYTRTVLIPFPKKEAIDIRSYVFIMDTAKSLGNAEEIKNTLEIAAGKVGGHLSGMYIQGKGFFRSVHGEPHKKKVPNPQLKFNPVIIGKEALPKFKSQLYSDLARYPRPAEGWTPAIDRYYDNSSFPSIPIKVKPRPDGQGKYIKIG